ncbi:MAG: hypothetical protein KGL57_07625 [Burkholderiales bacterium]|nr:hypothetical protein [Burkholderiales bacterium]
MATKVDPFTAFVQSRRQNLRRIAARTCGEYTEGDVMGEAWLLADRIGLKRGFPVDFSNWDDQEIVLAWLFNELVRFADKQTRYAVRLDKDWDQEDAGAAMEALSRFLVAPEEFDPAVAFQIKQEQGDLLSVVRYSYSQAAAYLILLDRFTWDLDDLANHLRVVVGTLHCRIHQCAVWIRHQPSLFDRISMVEADFLPSLAVRRRSAVEIVQTSSGQLQWASDDWAEPQ